MVHGTQLIATVSEAIHINQTIRITVLLWIYRYGNWGICFTYGTWFALAGLAAAGKTYNDCEAIRKGVHFLLAAQKSDGGWGESYLSCSKKVYAFTFRWNQLDVGVILSLLLIYAEIHSTRRGKIKPGANGLGYDGSHSRWTGLNIQYRINRSALYII